MPKNHKAFKSEMKNLMKNSVLKAIAITTIPWMGLYGDETICTQVITNAINTSTNVCKAFQTPCDVPSGWSVVERCSDESAQLEKRISFFKLFLCSNNFVPNL